MNQTLDQRRAAHVLEMVRTEQNLNKEHKSAVESLPATIMASGLGPTLAFLKAKDSYAHYDWTYKTLSRWLMNCKEIPWSSSESDLLNRLAKESSFVYRAATQEALAYASWLKRAVQARVGDSKQ